MKVVHLALAEINLILAAIGINILLESKVHELVKSVQYFQCECEVLSQIGHFRLNHLR